MASSSSRRSFLIGVSLVIGGCCLNNVFLENLVVADRASGQLLTLLQFAFIALLSVYERFERGPSGFPRPRSTSLPLWWYLLLTSIFWTLSVLNNMAYDFQISQPLHMVFRSSSLAVSLLLGFFLFKKSYSWPQTLGVVIVTVGIFATTMADTSSSSSSAPVVANATSSGCGPNGCAGSAWFSEFGISDKAIGVAILTSGLFLSSLLGHLQSYGYEYWKRKDENEAMFFQHFFSIFFFAPLSSSLMQHAQQWSASPVYLTFGSWGSLTWMWFNVWGNLITQYICIRGVFLLMSTSGPVTTTMVLTVRKFISLFISIAFFDNRWTMAHWIGTSLVFGGAFVYGAHGLFVSDAKPKEKKE